MYQTLHLCIRQDDGLISVYHLRVRLYVSDYSKDLTPVRLLIRLDKCSNACLPPSCQTKHVLMPVYHISIKREKGFLLLLVFV